MSEPALMIVMIDVDAEHEEELNRWYDEEHVPERMAVPGFLSARRLRSVEGTQYKYVTIYELASRDCLDSREYLSLKTARSAWTARMYSYFKNLSRVVYVETSYTSGQQITPSTLEKKI